jgi:hypothetical protein
LEPTASLTALERYLLAAIERWLATRMNTDLLVLPPDLLPGFLGAVISVANRD